MCIAILNQKGTLSKKTLAECWLNNADGAGLAYFDGAKIVIEKEMKSFKCFYDTYYQKRNEHPDKDFLIHFRIATHGKINETNCHPFKINKTSAFIHNGIISRLSTKGEFSDTYQFNEMIIKKLPVNWMKSKTVIELVEGYIGYSKLVFLFGNSSLILNERLGKWDKGNWFSNNSYKPVEPIVYKNPTVQPSGKYSNAGNDLWDAALKEYDSYKDRKKADAKQYCECCDELAKLTYVSEFNVDMCDKCIKSYSFYVDPEETKFYN